MAPACLCCGDHEPSTVRPLVVEQVSGFVGAPVACRVAARGGCGRVERDRGPDSIRTPACRALDAVRRRLCAERWGVDGGERWL